MNAIMLKDAVKVFYYLLASDGKVQKKELKTFDLIGRNIDPENFDKYKDSVISECEEQMLNIIDDEDIPDVAQEGIDSVLFGRLPPKTGIGYRCLVWDMLVLSVSDGEYNEAERRIIKHIVRRSGFDRTIFAQMEDLAITYAMVIQEEARLKSSTNISKEERKPLLKEIRERKKVIRNAAEIIISEDEIEFAEPDIKEKIRNKVKR